jgi:hypothetical protein
VGNDAASSAQSKRRGTWLNGDSTRGRGSETVAGGGSDTLVAVKGTGGGETDRLWGVWGKLGGWDIFEGRFGVPGSEARRFAAADCGPGWGKAWGSIVVVDDVAVRVGA